MIDFITLILSLTLTATLLFGAVKMMAGLKFPICEIYILERLVCIFYLLPALVIIGWWYGCLTEGRTVFIRTADFSYVIYGRHFWKLPLLKNDNTLQTINMAVFIGWTIGFCVFYVIDLVRSMLVLRHLIIHCISTPDEYLWQLMNDIKKNLNIKRNIKLYQTDQVDMPFTTGFFRMKVVLPIAEYSKEEWLMLLKHELIHCKRNDVFMKMILRFVQKIHWFNPLIFLFSRSFCEDCEYTCDMEVVKNYSSEYRKQYGGLIIKMAEERPMPKFTIGFSDNNFKFVERRLRYIMKRRTRRGVVVTAIMAAFMAICPFVTYASTFKVSQLESGLINVYDEHRGTAYTQVNGTVKTDQVPAVYESEELGRLDARGANNVDTTIAGNGSAQFSPVSMSAGSSIRISVSSENQSDSFRAGIIAPSGKKFYVDSVDGMAAHTFSIDTSGSYKVYFEGRNGSGGSDIHITGTIYVNY